MQQSTKYWTIKKSITGWLISMPCPITGKKEDAHISAICGIEHINANARSLSNGKTSAQEVAIISEVRMQKALAIKAKRHREKELKQDVLNMIDCGIIPSLSQLRKAGMA